MTAAPAKAILAHPSVTLVSRLILGAVFVVASIDKIALPEAFAVSIEAYKMTPTAIVNVAALVLPWLELVCGILLIAGVAVRPSAVLISGLLVVFLVAIMSALFRGLTIDCGCFGAAHATPVSWLKVVEDLGLLALGLHLIVFPHSAFSLGDRETIEGDDEQPRLAAPHPAPIREKDIAR